MQTLDVIHSFIQYWLNANGPVTILGARIERYFCPSGGWALALRYVEEEEIFILGIVIETDKQEKIKAEV